MGPPTADEFPWFYSVKSNKNSKGFYYFAKRPVKKVAGRCEDQGQSGDLEGVVLLYP